MATEILAVGTLEAQSSDVVVAAGTPLTVALKGSASVPVGQGASVLIQLKDDANRYWTVDTLNEAKPAVMIQAAGTYRFVRQGGPSCGVFSG